MLLSRARARHFWPSTSGLWHFVLKIARRALYTGTPPSKRTGTLALPCAALAPSAVRTDFLRAFLRSPTIALNAAGRAPR